MSMVLVTDSEALSRVDFCESGVTFSETWSVTDLRLTVENQHDRRLE